MGRDARDRGRARRGRPSLQRPRRALHGALRSRSASSSPPATGWRSRTTRRSPRAGEPSTAAYTWTSPTARSPTSWRSCRACTASSSKPRCSTSPESRWRWRPRPTTPWAASLSSRRPTPPMWRASTPPARPRRGCTGPTGSGATRSPRRSSSAGAPARRPPRSPCPATYNCAPGRRYAEADDELSSFIREGDEFARPLQRALRNTMWECCGVVRNEEKLREGLNRLEEDTGRGRRRGRPSHLRRLRRPGPRPRPSASLVSAEASLLGAIERRESRGAHNRSDYPKLDPSLEMNFVVTRDDAGNLSVSGKPVEAVPDHLESLGEGRRGSRYRGQVARMMRGTTRSRADFRLAGALSVALKVFRVLVVNGPL